MKKSRETSPTARKVAKDVFTIPNLISVTGAALAIHGSEEIDTPEGLAKCAVGRLADVLDGKVARMTGQTSNFGAALDATTDKIVMAKILYEMYKKGLAPKHVLGIVALLNSINAGVTGITNLRSDKKAETRPTKSGKLAMAGETVTLISYIAAHVAEQDKNPKLAKLLRKLGAGAFAASLPFAVHATHTYIKRAINGDVKKEKPEEPRQITDVNRTLGSMAMLGRLSGRS
ncbi:MULTISPECIES: CDP-alcohol phosphatidyltransferase family protein [unclassified Candidatus Nanosynbacter]|uniref:CDP-alcohol phosphatidyltransferase family protein n=1 Tax=unclassified Candidatus Nanosynbacter TaxID=2725944 RepID=UPI001FB84C55|nr:MULTISPECIES: CDP-alcohol phosphatidyltransferase family protein [unclassified Candidatus Nanosynbacter]MCJ1963174.1 CDP-alcohol phosphatidyltransferase family protein [Candidatus Nanosynbacter sp. TM7-033]UOG67663.1 CDP-alcohol phosphatidyltransferase family protein [Candidatus Nanosynbacter sp. HMT-352]